MIGVEVRALISDYSSLALGSQDGNTYIFRSSDFRNFEQTPPEELAKLGGSSGPVLFLDWSQQLRQGNYIVRTLSQSNTLKYCKYTTNSWTEGLGREGVFGRERRQWRAVGREWDAERWLDDDWLHVRVQHEWSLGNHDHQTAANHKPVPHELRRGGRHRERKHPIGWLPLLDVIKQRNSFPCYIMCF